MAEAAHDLNNLLAAILGAAQLIESRLAPGHPARSLAVLIGTAAQRGRGLTRQVLEAGRPGSAPARRVGLELGTLVQEALDFLAVVVPSNVTVQARLAPGIRILGNADQIHQVFMNILVNACDAVRSGGGTVQVDLGLEEQDGAEPALPAGTYAAVTVRDSGPGMEAEVLDQIFNPFFTTRQGYGLGLAIARKAVARHGGAIQVTSEPGHGTEFRVLLPAAAADPGVAGCSGRQHVPD